MKSYFDTLFYKNRSIMFKKVHYSTVFRSKVLEMNIHQQCVVAIVQSLSCVWVFATPWTAALQGSLSFTISWSLLTFMCVELVMLTISSSATLFSSCLQSFPASGGKRQLFPNESSLHISGQSIEASASASVLPVNIQGWFLLRLTGLISLESTELSRVFSSTTIQKHQFFST